MCGCHQSPTRNARLNVLFLPSCSFLLCLWLWQNKKKARIKWEKLFSIYHDCVPGAVSSMKGTIRFSFIICIWVGHGSLGQYQNSTSRHSCARGEEEFMIKQLWQMMRGEQSHRGGTLCSHHTWNIIPVHGLCPAASLDPDWMCILVGRVWYMSHYKVHVYVPVLL